MKLAEYNKVKELDYNAFVNYLNDKYGKVEGNYFDIRKDGTLKRGTAGVRGYYIHHVKEYEVPNLCDKAVAEANPIEYQYSENLVQADALEHFFLHILIAEEFDQTDDLMVGEGGVIWIATTINGKVNKEELSEEEYEIFLHLINRYCTSSFIRQKHNRTPEDLLRRLLGQARAKRYDDYLKAAKDTKLFGWNINAFSDLQNYLKNYRTAGLVICTGGGKTTTALEYLRVHNAKALVIGPSNTIGTGWEDNEDHNRFKYDYINYQTFQNKYATMDYSTYDVIICDEMHHTEAPRWGEGLQFVLDNTNLKIIGLTATPSAEQKHGNDKYFGGRLCWGLNLADGIRNNNIHEFGYVSALYKLDRELLDKRITDTEAGRQMLGRLDLELNKNPIHKILSDNMPKSKRKIIVFVQEQSMFKEARDILIKYNPNYASEEYARVIYSGLNKDHPELDKNYVEDAKKWFNQEHDHDVVLFTINMANEGAHFEGINTLIMFRKTNSATLYLQQLGRIVVTSNKADPEGIVFDFTNNAQSLIHRAQIVVKKIKEVEEAIDEEMQFEEDEIVNVEEDENSKKADSEIVAEIQNALKDKAEEVNKNKGKVVIYKDYTEQCAETLSALYDTQKRSNVDAQIYCQLEDELLNDNTFMELWKDLKIEASGRILISTKRSDKKLNTHDSNSVSREQDAKKDKEQTVAQIVEASDAEKLATVYKLLVRRAYSFGAIDFEDNIKLGIKMLDKDLFDSICEELGIKNSNIIVKAIQNLAKITFILATNI